MSFSEVNIIIIHKIPIIRNGLYQIVYEEFGANTFMFEDLNQTGNYEFSENLLFIIDEDYYNRSKQEVLSIKSNAKWQKVILVKMLAGKNYMEDHVFASINFNDDVKHILKIVNECISTKSNTIKNVSLSLSEREKEVLKNIALGNSNKEIADKLFISVHTVIAHRKNITQKLGIKSISGLAIYAVINNILDASDLKIS